ncbi:MAG: hypothetical protein JO014_15860 [Metakosakonia sp.]|nr:hypothetical protein [Phytobacter sp.]MBV8874184.1 hypothetical protein [Phytobacter sp.]
MVNKPAIYISGQPSSLARFTKYVTRQTTITSSRDSPSTASPSSVMNDWLLSFVNHTEAERQCNLVPVFLVVRVKPMQKNTLNSNFSKTVKERLNLMLEDIVVKTGETTI